MLPPTSVSIPRSDIPMEAIIGIQTKRKEAMSRESLIFDFTLHANWQDELRNPNIFLWKLKALISSK